MEPSEKRSIVRADINRPNLCNAAYCAGQYALETEPAPAKQLLDKTTNWMQQDLKIRNSALIDIQTCLLSKNEVAPTTQLESKRLQLLENLGFIKASS